MSSRLVDRPEVVDAVASFFDDDPDRIRAVAARFQPLEKIIQSEARGISMGRTIPSGARIRIVLSHREPRIGDVVALLNGTQVVVHRVVHLGRRGAAGRHLLTRGDVARLPDPPVERAHVLGTVTAVEQNGVWAPPGDPWRQSIGNRALTRVVLTMTILLLAVRPRVATTFVAGVSRVRRRLLRLGTGRTNSG